jgi:hypothetical protein
MITEIPNSKTMHGLQFSKFETKIKIYLRQSNEIQLISHKKIDSLSNTRILYYKFIECKFLDEFYDKINTKE